ncbi:hypothetical protein M427DRAFT_51731 [Gonapodya prolifera JEL478]|uniref:Uncharacterized protein n=1 Tax=Gonapodya prolifera (strain JEL478) TaxID=1344416 RepID=A0A139AVP1_GONPJ|nr:hypothetical protein M427DRAFT_51731 [Gonapodya prolifera JEL478]|eukprot:KXS20769.1 hypothetical protein M427DRAFT_51731 [Gonapodya prolifera JEL478]
MTLHRRRLPLAAILLCAVLLVFSSTVSGAPAGDKLDQLNKRLSSNPSSPITLSQKDYELFTSKPRNYSLIVVLTAMQSQLNCHICRDFEPELKDVTAAWARQKAPNTLFFGVLDFKDAQATFQSLQVRTVPIVYYFPPTASATGKVEPETYDVPRKGKDAEDFANWVEATAHVKIGYKKPLNYAAIFSALLVVMLVIVLGKLFSDNILWVLQNKLVWMALGLVFVIMMTSATMWNSIRGAEYVGVRNGQPEVIAPGFGNQYVVETQVVGLMYGLVSLSFVGMVHAREAKGVLGQWGPLVLLGIFMFLLSWLFAVFKRKNGGYPFGLLF